MSRRARAAEGSSVTAFSDDGRSSGGGAPPSAEWKELMALSPDDLEDALQRAGSALKEGRELKTSAKAVLALQLDDDDALAEPEQLLHALRIAQVALRGERARGDAGEKAAAAGGTAGSAGTDAGLKRKLDEALAEAKRATDDARAAREELKQVDDELQDKREEVELSLAPNPSPSPNPNTSTNPSPSPNTSTNPSPNPNTSTNPSPSPNTSTNPSPSPDPHP